MEVVLFVLYGLQDVQLVGPKLVFSRIHVESQFFFPSVAVRLDVSKALLLRNAVMDSGARTVNLVLEI